MRVASGLGLWLAIVAGWSTAWPVRTSDDHAPTVVVLITLREQPVAAAAIADLADRLRLSSSPVAAGEQPGTAHDRDHAAARRVVRLIRRAARDVPPTQAAVARQVVALGGEILHAGRAFNVVAVRMPRRALATLRAHPDVAAVEIDVPRTTQLATVAPAMLADTFWNHGVRGGAVDVAVVDTGLYAPHEAYAPRRGAILGGVFHRAAQGRSDYYDVPTSDDDYAGHGTFVSGMIFGQGAAVAPLRKGIAHGIDRLYNLKAGYAVYPSGGANLLADLLEAVDWALAQPDPPEVFNYSFGARVTSADDAYTRFWDGVVDTFGVTATISAGNGGPHEGTIGSPAIAYNVISVANIAHRGTLTRADDALATGSSRGPAPDGRKKPDLAAPGTAIWLPSHYGPFAWLQASGTSFSSPALAAAAALLIDAGVTDPRAVKAVLINTADDLGPAGWDPGHGWGYYNGERAWAERSAVTLLTIGPPGTPTSRRYFERTAAAPTRATLVWHRHAVHAPGAGTVSFGVLNDLDLRLHDATTGVLRAASLSAIDNVEQVATPTAEPAVLVVESKGTFTGAVEHAALASGGGFVERQGPGLRLQLGLPGTVAPGSEFLVAATVSNSGDLRGHDHAVALVLPAGFALLGDPASRHVGSLAPGAGATVTWRVRAPVSDTLPRAVIVTATSASYGVPAATTATATLTTASTCTYSVEGPRAVAASGGVTTLEVLTGPACAWWATTGSDWLAIDGATAGVGPGRLTVRVDANTRDRERTATLHVAGLAIGIVQEGAAQPVPRRYYLAEGATGPLFDLDVIVANPTEEAAPVRATFLRPDGDPVVRELEVAPMRRVRLRVNEIEGLATGDVSTVIESHHGVPLVVERTMTWDRDGYGGHTGGAVDAPQTAWYFAEGAQGFFDTYLLLANAEPMPARVEVTWLREGEPPVTTSVVVPPRARHTMHAASVPALVGRSFATIVRSDVPIMAERAMYWSNATTFWVGGHESAGVTAPATRWWFAEGATGEYFDTFLLVGNPNPQPAHLTVTYLLPTGRSVVREHTVDAMARLTIYVAHEDPSLASTAVSATIVSDVPVVAERAMYWPGPVGHWLDGHNSFGVTAAVERWGLAEGCEGGPRNAQTYLLIANPGPVPATVRVSWLPEGGPHVVREYRVGATSRFNVQVASEVPELAGRCFGAVVESTNGVPIVVERAMYWDARGRAWAAGTNATAAPLR